jgi:hypothetical protein
MEATGLLFWALYEKEPSLVGDDVVTDIKIDCTSQDYGSCVWTDWFRHEGTRQKKRS